jgi:hypothetical protein
VSFTAGQKEQDNRDYDKDDGHEKDPRYRRDKSVSTIRTHAYVQTKSLLAAWARLHYGLLFLAFRGCQQSDALRCSLTQPCALLLVKHHNVVNVLAFGILAAPR